jgi:hypothetical protein
MLRLVAGPALLPVLTFLLQNLHPRFLIERQWYIQ